MKQLNYFDWTVRGLSLAVAGGAILTIGFAANAQPIPGDENRGPGRFMERADGDGDGNVSLEEFQKMAAEDSADHFAHMDSNGDGVINAEDVRPSPRPEGDFGPRGGERARPEGDFGRRGGGPRPEGDFGPRGGGPRPEGDFGHRGYGPRPEGDFGRHGDGPRGPGKFQEKADVDGSGGVSFEELKAIRPDATQEDFNKRDTNGDGVLNREDRNGDRLSKRGTGPEGMNPCGPRGSQEGSNN